MSNKDIWTIKLDWLNIIHYLGLDSIDEIPELKREKVIKKLTKLYGTEYLMELDSKTLEELVVNELMDLMKKELTSKAKKQEQMQRDIQEKFIPFKNGGIININQKDLKDLDIDLNGDPTEILKKLADKFFKADNDKDDDKDRYEDNTGYYI
ncbi:MAG: hypothetical protein ACFFAS_12140 [Promethearchaeota archaeon]